MEYRKKLGVVVCALCCLIGCSHNGAKEATLNTEELIMWQGKVAILDSNVEDLQQYMDAFLECHEDTDYGLAYGITAVLCEELELCEVTANYTEEELAAYFSDEEQMYLLDFTLPMFETYFFDEDTVAYVQAAAISFAEYVNDQGKLDELYQICLSDADEDEAKLVELKNEWLVSIGVENVYEPFAPIHIEYNDIRETENYPYVIKEESANWFFASADVREVGYQEFVEEYVEVAPAAELDFAEARDLLKAYIPENIEPVDIFTNMTEKQEGDGLCVHNRAENKIGIYTNWAGLKQCLLHEYIHYLTVGDNKLFENSLGLVEGVTDALACLTCENRLRALYFADALSHVVYGDESYAFVKEIGALEPNMDVVDGEIYYYYDAKAYYELEPQTHKYFAILWEETVKPEVMSLGALSYSEAGSLSKYLIEQYGLDEVLTHCTSATEIEELTGLPFAQLYDEWGRWNEQRYQELKNEY